MKNKIGGLMKKTLRWLRAIPCLIILGLIALLILKLILWLVGGILLAIALIIPLALLLILFNPKSFKEALEKIDKEGEDED